VEFTLKNAEEIVMSLKIRQLSQGAVADTYRIALEGRLDGSTSPELEQVLKPVLDSNPKVIIFELAKLDFISSAGIRVLIETQKKLTARNGSVILTEMQPQIQKVLEIIKALPGIAVFRNVEEMDQYLALMQEKYKKE
jgi:anti-sigma B factor antagonist